MSRTIITLFAVPALTLTASAQLSLVSNQPGAFIDIAATGTPLNLADDGEVTIFTTVGNALLPAGDVRIGSNGGVRFRGTGTNLALLNAPLPAFGAFSFESQSLLPFWDDINSAGGTMGQIYWEEVNGVLIIEWKDVGFFGQLPIESTTFQIQVPSTGAVHARFVYSNVELTRADGGGSATIGYQSGGYGADIQHSFNTSGAVSNGTVLSLVGSFAPPPPPPPQCLATPFNGGSGISAGNACFFDLTATQAVTLSGIQQNYNAAIGSPVGVLVYTAPGTYAGNELNVNAWTLVASDNGAAVSADEGLPTAITFMTPLNLAAGTYGVAVVPVGSTQRYSIGNGTNQNFMSPDGRLLLAAGSVTAVPFMGAVISPRVWNGRFCASSPAQLGASYCGPAALNSTGNAARMSLTGSASVAVNMLTLGADQMPASVFGFFVVGPTQGFISSPGTSQGHLCLSGSIGRFVGPGQVLLSNPSGAFSLPINLSLVPTPSSFVQVVAGEVWNFQAWYRDSNPGVTSNFTDGRTLTFLP